MDKIYIQGVLQRVLNKEFSNSQKRHINVYPDRLNMACMFCHDSSRNDHAKRGNLYFNKLFYICFNCDKKTSFDRICKQFNEQIDPDKKMEMIEHLNSVITYEDYESDFSSTNLEDLIDLSDIEKAFNNKNSTLPIYDFKPIDKNSGVYKYLLGRGITEDLQKNIYQAKFSKGDDDYEHIIVLLNRRKDKVLGMQVRNLRKGKNRFFLIYNWENIYHMINGSDIEVDQTKAVIYNKLSYYFNILNIDFEKTITIFEGYLDSLFYPNSIGLVGTNSDLRFIESNNLDLQYFFDNDPAGFKKSEEKIRQGFKVFLWKMLFNDIVNKKTKSDPYELMHKISKVKDLNNLAELVPNVSKKLHLNNFFSMDIYDLQYLPKVVEWKKIFKKKVIT